MNQTAICYKPIGLIHSDHVMAEKTPIQSVFARGCRGQAEIYQEYIEGLRDLEGFSHIYLIYHFHQAGPASLRVIPFMEDSERGIYATRSPRRPNSIGLSIVELIGREGNILHLEGVDILEGTPLLDIKPYTSKFDRFETTRNGWQDKVDENIARQRGRRGYTG